MLCSKEKHATLAAVIFLLRATAAAIVDDGNAPHNKNTTHLSDDPQTCVDYAAEAAVAHSNADREQRHLQGNESRTLPGNFSSHKEQRPMTAFNVEDDDARDVEDEDFEDDDEDVENADDEDFGDDDDEDVENDGDEDEERIVGSAGAEFGVVQLIAEYDEEYPSILAKLYETEDYMEEFVEKFPHARGDCWNKDKLCIYWAASGECESNPDFMRQDCAPACGQCVKPVEEDVENYGDEDEAIYGSAGAGFGVVQFIDEDDENFTKILAKLNETEAYMNEFVENKDKFPHIRRECWNKDKMCIYWAAYGECESNPDFMKQYCSPACGQCVKPVGPGVEFGVSQTLIPEDPVFAEQLPTEIIEAKLAETANYMRDVIWADDFYKSVRKWCFNKEDMCTVWAAEGECDKNHLYMIENCSPACGTCKELHYDTRCAADPNDPNIWGPGDLHRVFERIVAANGTIGFHLTNNSSSTNGTIAQNVTNITPIEVTVWSRPDYLPGDNESTADYKVGPWVIAVDNFLTPQEANQFIQHGNQNGFTQSTGVGEIDEATGEYDFMIDEGRTSTNAWCEDACQHDPIISTVLDRIESMTGIPRHHSESLQLLKYEVGQFYGTHHDYLDHERDSVQGPRILTVFIYLNDVEEGGETRFDWFGSDVKVQPKLGRVVLWPSVLDADPLEIDNRTEHEALPVLRGRKYAANAWFHMRNFEKGNAMNC